MRSSSIVGGKARLADQALRLKKAWLLAVACQGLGNRLGSKELTIPAYRSWTRQELQEHVQNLIRDFVSIMRTISPVDTRQPQPADWPSHIHAPQGVYDWTKANGIDWRALVEPAERGTSLDKGAETMP